MRRIGAMHFNSIETSADERPTRVRFLIIGLCVAMSVLLYLDRFALSPATDAILACAANAGLVLHRRDDTPTRSPRRHW